jgi:hypothetical protein
MSEVITGPDSLQPATVDFNSLYEKAMAHSADPTAESPTPVDPAEAAPTAYAETAPGVPDTPQAVSGHVFDIPEDSLVRVKIDGVEQTVPYKEYKDGIQREAAFTKRMQTLAAQRQEAEQVFAQRAADLQRQAEMLAYAQQQLQQQSNPVAQLQQLLAQQNAPQPRQSDPNEIATLGEVQSSLAEFQRQMAEQQQMQQQQMLQQIQMAGHQLREEQALQADAARFTAGLNATLEKDDFKVLRDVIPFAEESIRYQVAQLNPQSIDEAINFAEQIANEWAGKVRATSDDYLKRQEVAKARAKMGPPTGSPPPPTAQRKPGSFFQKDGKLDWKSLEQRALNYLE